MKLQDLVDITLFYSCLLMSEISALTSSKEPEIIHARDALKLRLVNAVFRHGDRTVDRTGRESYPNDPYKSDEFFPNGDGQLTNAGKKRSYELGLLLRHKYNSFLGDAYYPPNIYARSTWMTRSKTTLQFVLAALYQPVDIEKWNPELSWQPMDIVYVPPHEDDLLFPIECSRYLQVYDDLLKSPEVKKKIEKFNDLMKIMSKYTGRNITSLTDLVRLYNTLYAQSLMGLHLPEWTQDIFPNGKLLNATLLFFELLSYDKLNNLNGGVLLNRIINDMNNVINGSLVDRKINLFSGHDINVAGMLYALNVSEYRFPAYTSSVIIELYEKDGTYFVKVLYYLGIPPDILEVIIPGCEVLCPYNKFVELTRSTTVIKQPCHSVNEEIDKFKYTVVTSLNDSFKNKRHDL